MPEHGTRGAAPPRIEIPITAMLDMSFQLLFFFIMHYKPSMMEGQMDMALPARPPAAGATEGWEPAADPELHLPADITVTAQTAKDGGPDRGSISRLTVRGRAGETVLPTLEALKVHLARAGDGLSNNTITIVGDSALRWSEVVRIMDACKAAGFQAGFGAPPDLRQ